MTPEEKTLMTAMAERLEDLNRRVSSLVNRELLDDTHIVAMARRAAMDEPTPERIAAYIKENFGIECTAADLAGEPWTQVVQMCRYFAGYGK